MADSSARGLRLGDRGAVVARNLALILALGSASSAACSADRRTNETCAEGTIATASGCFPIPNAPDLDAAADVDAGSGSVTPDSGSRPRDAGGAAEVPDAADGADAAPDAEPGDAGAGDAEPGDATPIMSLTGTWAAKATTKQTVYSNYATVRIDHGMLMRTVVVQSGTTVSLEIEACDRSLSPIAGITLTHPTTAIPIVRALGRLNSTTDVRPVLEVNEWREVFGWQPQAAGESPPLDPADARLTDDDGDGHPGVTLSVSSPAPVELYVAGLTGVAVAAYVFDNDVVEGLVSFTMLENVVARSSSLVDFGTILMDTEDADLPNSSFRMVRLPSPGMSCGDVRSAQGTLFP